MTTDGYAVQDRRVLPLPSAAAARLRGDGTNPAGWVSAQKVMCGLLVVLLGARLRVLPGVSPAVLVALLLLPIWVRRASTYRYAVVLGATFWVAIASGLWLSGTAHAFHVVSRMNALLEAGTLVGTAVTAGFLLWARSILPSWLVGALYGGGLLLSVRTDGNYSVSPWRFGFATPVTVIALSLALRTGRRWVEVLAACALAAASVVAGGRSPAAVLVLVAVLVLWQHLPPARSRRTASARVALTFGAVGYATYVLGQAAILDGVLGEAARDRTQLQLQQSGNLFVGGRPEMAATLALIRHFPLGFGLGVAPNSSEILVAKEGLAGIHYNPNNGYVESYMFGTSFVLHSNLGELWAWLGLPGLLLGAVVLVVVSARTISAVSAREASALFLFPALLTIWNLFFSPTLTSASIAALCLGFVLDRRPRAAPVISPASGPPARAIMTATPAGRTLDGTA